MQPEVWLFDIDGTLILTDGAGEHAARLAMQSAFGAAPDSGSVHFAGRTDRSITSDLFELHQVDDTPESWHRFQQAYLEHLRRLLTPQRGRVLPGVVALLERLAATPALIGLVTGNVQDAAHLKLRNYQIDGFFQFGGYGDDHHDRNDVARTAFEQAQSYLGGDLDPQQVIVVGDTPNDVRCGQAIGARTIAVATGSCDRQQLLEVKPDLVMDDLMDCDRLRSLLTCIRPHK
jgi:phosphoglycolate phosphatase-like HAD superfamily hydrolase